MHREDKVTDVLAVLTAIRNGFKSELYGRDCTELRKSAVMKVAESELWTGRYKNMDSAFKTIHDACARRLKPDVANIAHFDRLTDQWLFRNSTELERIIRDHSESIAQRVDVTGFFRDNM
jgi:pyridoxine 5'-phosphate synthase PdxJ